MGMPRLVLHEEGHGRLARKYAKRIDDRLTSLEPERDCQVLEDKANTVGYNLLKALDKKNRLYDTNTNHGETQNAWLYQHL